MITQAEYRSAIRRYRALFCYGIFVGVLFVGIPIVVLIHIFYFPDSLAATLSYNIRNVAIGIWVMTGVGALGISIRAIYGLLVKMAAYKREAAIYFNAIEHRIHAYVVSKMHQQSIGADEEDKYHAAFDFFDGQRKSFIVNASQYNSLIEKETGLLIYKQNGMHLFFGDFHPQR